jgi:hypothetical protein
MISIKAGVCFWVVCLAVVTSGCKTKLNRSRDGDVEVIEPTVKPPQAAAAASAILKAVQPPPRPAAAGPAFPVEPGEGLGPIRFGSTVATVERHMQTKCEVLTDKYCRYIAAGIELELTDGAVSGIVIHRYNRPVAGDPTKKWGLFAGGIPPKVMMMMLPEAVIEQLGKPKRTEAITNENPNWTVRRDTYDGMVLEYDKNRANDRLMLGQIRVVKR